MISEYSTGFLLNVDTTNFRTFACVEIVFTTQFAHD